MKPAFKIGDLFSTGKQHEVYGAGFHFVHKDDPLIFIRYGIGHLWIEAFSLKHAGTCNIHHLEHIINLIREIK